MHRLGKRLISCLLVVAMIMGLAACGIGKSDQLQGEISISVYESEEWLEIAAAIFMQEHPDVKISIHNFYNQTELDMYSSSSVGNSGARPTGQTREDYIAQLNTQIMSGEAEDIIITSIGIPIERYIQMGVFEDLSPYLEKEADINDDNYYMNIFDSCRAEDGGLYQFPLSAMAVPLMVFDGELMENTGVRPNEGISKITWREALDLAKEMYDKSTFPATYMTDANSIAGNMFTKAAMDAMNYETGTVEFDRERMLSLLKIYVELADYKQAGQNTDVDHIPFSLAYRPDWEWARDIVIYEQNYAAYQWEHDDGSVYLCPYYALDFGINSESENKEIAWEFLKFLVSDEIQTLPALPWSGVNKKGLRARIEGALTSGSEREYTEEEKQAVFEMVDNWILEINAYRQEDSELIALTEGVLEEFKNGTLSAYETLDDLENKLEQFMSE